jgi:hypothetical protein
MRRMYRFLCLPARDHHLLVRSAFLLGGIRLGLWLLPFERLRRVLARAARWGCRASADRVVWAVSVASRYVPMATCLAQALATQVLLGGANHPASVRIGVARGEEGRLRAHAWVESEGRVLIGSLEDLAHYVPMPPLGDETP